MARIFSGENTSKSHMNGTNLGLSYHRVQQYLVHRDCTIIYSIYIHLIEGIIHMCTYNCVYINDDIYGFHGYIYYMATM